jgi:hypothetical protein
MPCSRKCRKRPTRESGSQRASPWKTTRCRVYSIRVQTQIPKIKHRSRCVIVSYSYALYRFARTIGSQIKGIRYHGVIVNLSRIGFSNSLTSLIGFVITLGLWMYWI